MKEIEFSDIRCKDLYRAYLENCKKVLSILGTKDQEDSMLEINSFIFEFLEANKQMTEKDALKTILKRLGDPSIFLKEIVATKMVNQAVSTFHIKHVFQAIYYNISNGFAFIVMAFLGLILITLPFLIVLKILYPSKVGLWIGGGDFFLGFSSETEMATEYLGSLFYPFTILLGLIIYMVIILILKFVKRQKNEKGIIFTI